MRLPFRCTCSPYNFPPPSPPPFVEECSVCVCVCVCFTLTPTAASAQVFTHRSAWIGRRFFTLGMRLIRRNSKYDMWYFTRKTITFRDQSTASPLTTEREILRKCSTSAPERLPAPGKDVTGKGRAKRIAAILNKCLFVASPFHWKKELRVCVLAHVAIGRLTETMQNNLLSKVGN